MQSEDDAPPIIEDPKLPKMSAHTNLPGSVRDSPTKSVRTKGTKMPENPAPDKGGKGRMKSVPSPIPSTHITPPRTSLSKNDRDTLEHVDQVAPKTRRTRQLKESYLRLSFHVENSQVTLLDVHEVEGPLKMPDELRGEVAYEVNLGSKRIGVGSLSDVGIRRGFPRPNADSAYEGHSIIELPSYDFFARVPKKEFHLSKLNKLKVSVFRIKDQPEKSLDIRPLEVQFSNNLREVARLEGIKINKLPVKLQSKLKKAAR
jgi:hypothetical protein